jgi:CubicO group peptidase (beta-lactamase class C family)
MNEYRRAAARPAMIALLALAVFVLVPALPGSRALAASQAQAQSQPQAGNDKPALAHLKAYVEAFNAGVPGTMRAYLASHLADAAIREIPVEQRLVRFRSAKGQLKSLELLRVVSDAASEASLLTKSGDGGYVLLKANVEATPPNKLLSLTIELIDNPDEIVVPDPKANEKELVAAVREFLEAETRADTFSGVVLVANQDRIVFHEAYGLADREKKIPNRRDTKFNLGSINKNFTRVAIHQLARLGKLGLDDKIAKFLPDYPNADAAGKVSIRQLLNMTSGIGDFFGERFDATPKEKIRTLQDYLPFFADLPLEFEPGTSNKYSNGGYIVLGLIIEKVTGLDYYTYVRENIYKPCGMTDTDAFARDADVPNLAHGYTREEEGATKPWVLNFATLPGRGSSAGGGYSTAPDLLKYVLALRDKKMYLPDAANGLGIAGGAPGINSVIEWDTRSGYTVIVLTNFDPPTAGQASRRIVGWLPR